jgi:hypothetical protein
MSGPATHSNTPNEDMSNGEGQRKEICLTQ